MTLRGTPPRPSSIACADAAGAARSTGAHRPARRGAAARPSGPRWPSAPARQSVNDTEQWSLRRTPAAEWGTATALNYPVPPATTGAFLRELPTSSRQQPLPRIYGIGGRPAAGGGPPARTQFHEQALSRSAAIRRKEQAPAPRFAGRSLPSGTSWGSACAGIDEMTSLPLGKRQPGDRGRGRPSVPSVPTQDVIVLARNRRPANWRHCRDRRAAAVTNAATGQVLFAKGIASPHDLGAIAMAT